MKNQKGFTLVELLAVIVILAVIILIAVNAVLPQMEKARKNAFKDEALNYMKQAATAYVDESEETAYDKINVIQSDDETPETLGYCISIADLNDGYVDKNDSNYAGVVLLKSDNDANFDKVIYAKNKNYKVVKGTPSSITVEKGSSIDYTTCDDVTATVFTSAFGD